MGQYLETAITFIDNLPYKLPPYKARNWGHAWHSLCSYHGKLKPSIAHFLISEFTSESDTILDPLCGVGTIPFEACLQNRIGIGNDLSEIAYIVTKAKIEKPRYEDTIDALFQLKEYINDNTHTSSSLMEASCCNDFGFNGKLPEYFESNTYKEILAGRKYLVSKLPSLTPAEAMVFSAFLHVLHGNRPYALSRTSHPLTPYAPRGEFIYKSVVNCIEDKIKINYKKDDFNHYTPGKAIWGDYRKLPNILDSIDAIISSPPFAHSMRFYMMNWMRLWLCGWDINDFNGADDRYIDKNQHKGFSIYSSFFDMCHRVLKSNGKLILHLGKSSKYDMAQELSVQASPYFDEVYRGNESVSKVEKHGIKDKGSTTEHQFLFLIKK